MIEIKIGKLTPVEFLGKEAWVSLVSYEHTDNDYFTLDILIEGIGATLRLKGSLPQIAKALGDEVSIIFA